MKVSISYLKSKEDKLTTIKKINETTGDYLHVDLMDGLFCGENNYQKDGSIIIPEVLRPYMGGLEIIKKK